MTYYIQMFGISLGLTLVVELIVAFCFGLRRLELLLVTLVNFLTNPAAVWLHTFLGVPQIPTEIAVVIIEHYVYLHFSVSHPLLLSLAANCVSWGLGLLIQTF